MEPSTIVGGGGEGEKNPDDLTYNKKGPKTAFGVSLSKGIGGGKKRKGPQLGPWGGARNSRGAKNSSKTSLGVPREGRSNHKELH